MKKRPIKEVREEIRRLDSELTHLVIFNVARNGPQASVTDEQVILQDRIAKLKSDYPNWERTQTPKGA